MKNLTLLRFTVAGVAAIASSSFAQEPARPEWAAKMEFVDKPSLQIDRKASGDLSGKARIVLKNGSAEVSRQVNVECVVFDQAGNTVDQMNGVIPPIKPGKLGIGSVSAYDLSKLAVEIECSIGPSIYGERVW